jgi:hypothetical protein
MMIDINASERGKAAANSNKTKQPMNDARFVKLLYAAVEESEDATPQGDEEIEHEEEN